ncbi:hypothetical protein ACCO45_008326 [Purpureocillium lilacinum]|uniref:Uncharacterized protein n=1 Tax=Purpureocillium lilacinum TaxID=33203 RepID=A0ACC4DNQ6_PURLI
MLVGHHVYICGDPSFCRSKERCPSGADPGGHRHHHHMPANPAFNETHQAPDSLPPQLRAREIGRRCRGRGTVARTGVACCGGLCNQTPFARFLPWTLGGVLGHSRPRSQDAGRVWGPPYPEAMIAGGGEHGISIRSSAALAPDVSAWRTCHARGLATGSTLNSRREGADTDPETGRDTVRKVSRLWRTTRASTPPIPSAKETLGNADDS